MKKPSPIKIALNPVKKSSQVHSIGYELNRPDKVLEDAAKTLTATIKGETGLPLFHGKPGV